MADSLRKSIPLTSPDFDGIKDSLKQYLKQQDQFKDYDFEGSGMAVLLDVLSYNSHMNAFYLNMVGNESFLSTAVRRSSVVNKARDLGYIPRSARCARAQIFIEVLPNQTTSFITIPKGTMFTSSTESQSFNFFVFDDQKAFFDARTGFCSANIDIFEGKVLTHEFEVTQDVIQNGVKVPNLNVDTTLMNVFVSDLTATNQFAQYTPHTGGLSLTPQSQVCFIDESEEGLIRIQFGDGQLGKALVIGSIIKVEYAVSSGPAPNGIGSFNLATSIPEGSLANIQTTIASFGGLDPEDIQSIKFNATKKYESSGRSVTANDYGSRVQEVYPNAISVATWGGQDNVPPLYGKILISIKPENNLFLSSGEKDRIIELLRQDNVVTIRPVIVDPDFTFVDVSSAVNYLLPKTSKLKGQIETVVQDSIKAYSLQNLERFNTVLRFSNLSTAIDNSDQSIASNRTSVNFAKRFYVTYGVSQETQVSFANAIVKGSISSSLFTYNGFENCQFVSDDDGDFINIISTTGGVVTTVFQNFGAVEYSTGTITVNPLIIQNSDQAFLDEITQKPYIRISATPSVSDIQASQRQILIIENVSVTATAV